MADNRLYGGNVVNPSMLGGASATPQQSALSGYTGSGQIPFIDNSKNLEYDPYHQLKLSFSQMMGQTFEKAVEHTRNRAYVQGMSSQVSGMAEEAMETNILTRAWSKAGYRDMEGRVALTNYKASVLSDLESGKLASLTPTEFQQYLNKQRDELMPYINNSSMLIREKLLERAVEEDVGLIQKHSEYHTKFIYDQELNSWNMDFSLQLMDLDASVGSYSYNTAIMNVGSTLGMLMQNDRISQEDKVKMATQVMSSMAYAGHVQAADAIRNMPIVPTDTGEMLPLRMFLTPEDDLKIQKGIETGFKRNKDRMQLDAVYGLYETVNQVKTNPLNPDNPARSDFVYHALGLVDQGLITVDKALKFIGDYDRAINGDGKVSAEVQSGLYAMADFAGMEVLGVSVNESRRSFYRSIAHLPMAEQVRTIQQVMAVGNHDAPNLMATVLEPSFSRMINGTDIEMDIDAFNSLALVLTSNLYSTSPSSTIENIISGFKDPDVALVMREVFRTMQITPDATPRSVANSLQTSLSRVKQSLLTEEGRTLQSNLKERREEGFEIIDKGTSESVSNTWFLPDIIKQFGKGGIIRNQLIPSELWDSSGNKAANNYVKQWMNAYARTSFEKLLNTHPYFSVDSLVDDATADVASNMTMIGDNSTYNMVFISNPAKSITGVLQQVDTTANRDDLLKNTLERLAHDAISRDSRAEYGNLAIASHFTGDHLNIVLMSRSEGKLIRELSYKKEEVMAVAQEEGRILDQYRKIKSMEGLEYVGKSGRKLKIHPELSDEYRDIIMSTPEEVAEYRLHMATLTHDAFEPTTLGGRTFVGLGVESGSKYYPKEAIKGSEISRELFDDITTKATSEAIYRAENHAVQLPQGRNKGIYMGILASIALVDPVGLESGYYDKFNDAAYEGDTNRMLHELSKTRYWRLKAQEDEDLRENTSRAKQVMDMQIGVDSFIGRLINKVRSI